MATTVTDMTDISPDVLELILRGSLMYTRGARPAISTWTPSATATAQAALDALVIRFSTLRCLVACSGLPRLASNRVITRLCLDNSRHLVDLGALSACPSLRNCPCVFGIAALASCPVLTSLDIYQCQAVPTIAALASCPALTSLDMQKCPLVTSIACLTSCPCLEALDLSWCRSVTSIAALFSCPHLTTLVVSGCTRLTRINALASCPLLTTLDAYGCTELTDIDALASCPILTTLNISSCTRLTDIDALASCPLFTALNISGCTGLTRLDALIACPLRDHRHHLPDLMCVSQDLGHRRMSEPVRPRVHPVPDDPVHAAVRRRGQH